MLQKILYLRQGRGIERRARLRLGGEELIVAGLALLDALDVGRELVGRLHERVNVAVLVLAEHIGIGRAQLRRQHAEQLLHGQILHRVVGRHDLRVVILDRCRQVAREDLGRVVIQRRRRKGVDVARPAEDVAPDHAERVCEYRDHVAVLLNVLGQGVAHQPPARDIAHARNERKEVGIHRLLPSKRKIYNLGTFYHAVRGM